MIHPPTDRVQDAADRLRHRQARQHALRDRVTRLLPDHRVPRGRALPDRQPADLGDGQPDRVDARRANALAGVVDEALVRGVGRVDAVASLPGRARPFGRLDDRLVARTIALGRGALPCSGRDNLETLRLGVLGIGLAPVPEGVPAWVDLLTGLVPHRDDRVGVDVPIALLVGMDAKHEAVVGEAVVQEGARSIGQGRHIRAGFGRDDQVHGVARGLRAERRPPLARRDPGLGHVRDPGTPIVGRRPRLDQPIQPVSDAVTPVVRGARHDAHGVDRIAGRALDPGLHGRLRAWIEPPLGKAGILVADALLAHPEALPSRPRHGDHEPGLELARGERVDPCGVAVTGEA